MRYDPALINFIGYESPPDPRQSRVRILPIPYDLTTSYRSGTREGPAAILSASNQVEWWDDELGFEPAAAGIATLAPVAPDARGPEAMLERVRAAAREWVHPEHLLVALGGEHSVTLPLVMAHREVFPDLCVLQVDAHADLRGSFQDSPLSHACVMRRVVELGVPIVQVGVRSLSRAEHELAASSDRIVTCFDRELHGCPFEEWSDRVLSALGPNVYVTIDVDGLDPAVMPSTGTPEPGGLSWHQLVSLLAAVLDSRHCVGADLVELAPIPGVVAPDFLAARLVYRLVGLVARRRGWANLAIGRPFHEDA